MTTIRTENAEVVIEETPDGRFARIERNGEIDYAGPLPAGTVRALMEVSAR